MRRISVTHEAGPGGAPFPLLGSATASSCALVSNSNSGNPSSRRNGITITFGCELCGKTSVLGIAQHKGATPMSRMRGKPRADPVSVRIDEIGEVDDITSPATATPATASSNINSLRARPSRARPRCLYLLAEIDCTTLLGLLRGSGCKIIDFIDITDWRPSGHASMSITELPSAPSELAVERKAIEGQRSGQR